MGDGVAAGCREVRLLQEVNQVLADLHRGFFEQCADEIITNREAFELTPDSFEVFSAHEISEHRFDGALPVGNDPVDCLPKARLIIWRKRVSDLSKVMVSPRPALEIFLKDVWVSSGTLPSP